MNKNSCLGAALLAFAFLGSVLVVHAGEMKAELDCGADVKLLKSPNFSPFPPASKMLSYDAKGLVFQLSTASKDPVQTGLYSLFGIIGDCEITVDYEWLPVVVPKGGEGVSCGIAVETDTLRVAVARGNFPQKDSAYRVSVGRPVNNQKIYNNAEYKTAVKRGQLVIRREKKELIILATDDAGELTELGARVPFTDATIQKVFFFADRGKSANELHARLSEIKIRAESLTTDPKRDVGGGWGWWLAVAAVVVVGAGGYVAYRRFMR